MNKAILLLLAITFASAGALSAASLERQRRASENLNIDTAGLKAKPATSQFEIQPTPVHGLGELIRAILRLMFSPNGDIEIQSPVPAAPEVEGALDDDSEEETYSETATYDPVDLASLPEDPFQPQGQQPQQGQGQQGQQAWQTAPAGREGAISSNGGDRIPEDLRRKAMDYFNANQDRIQNKRYVGVVDFSAHSSRQRFWIIDVQSGAERAMRVAHGAGSDPDNDGYATRFSNVPNSRASSLGFYVTGALYTGKHGRSMRLHGLSGTNSNALSRAVVIHDSNYVREANVRQGRSFGCLAVANSEIASVLASLRGGALIYAGLSNSEF